MSYLVLARKWRPRRFSELVGQAHIRRALTNALSAGRLHHAYLFTGTRGVGKTTLARILAKCLNCATGVTAEPCGTCEPCRAIDEARFVDLLEVDAASRTKVEQTRELLEDVPYAPVQGRFKIYLIDEVHMLSDKSFNALLKTLEEPPDHVKFLLCTTDPQRLPVTVLSRCLQFALKAMRPDEIAAHLRAVVDREGVGAESSALALLAEAADGSMRDALSLLDQAIAFADGQIIASDVETLLGAVSIQQVRALLEAILDSDGARLLAGVEALAAQGADFGQAHARMIKLLHRICVQQSVAAAGADDELAVLAGQVDPAEVQLHYQIAVDARQDLETAADPRIAFEMMVLRMLAFRPLPGLVASEVPEHPVPAAQGPGEREAPAPGAHGNRPRADTRTAPSEPARGSSRPHGHVAHRAVDDRATPARAGTRDEAPAPAVEPSARAGPAPLAVAEPGPAHGQHSEAGLARDWATLVPQLGLSAMEFQLASNSEVLRAEDGQIQLLLDQRLGSLRRERIVTAIQAALARHLGRAVRLEVIVGEPKAATPAALEQSQQRAREASLREAVASDPMVAGLRERFDARIIDIVPADGTGNPQAGPSERSGLAGSAADADPSSRESTR